MLEQNFIGGIPGLQGGGDVQFKWGRVFAALGVIPVGCFT